MAGHASNWFKPKGGALKGQSLYLSKAQQGSAGRSAILDALGKGESIWLAQVNTATPKGVALSALPQKSVGFPRDPLALEVIGSPGGSTGAKKVLGPDGTPYLRKRGSPMGGDPHLASEAVADSAYRVLGIPVPESQLTTAADGKLVKLSTWLEDAKSIHSFLTGSSEASSAVRKQLREGFAADALLANWDVIGMDYDNVLVKDGVAYRVDNGGALTFRAQGAPKGSKFGPVPLDVWTLRNQMNPQSAQAFSTVSIFDIAKQINGILPKRDALMATMPANLQSVMNARLDNMAYIASVATALEQQGANSSKVDTYLHKLMTNASQGTTLPDVDTAIATYKEKWA